MPQVPLEAKVVLQRGRTDGKPSGQPGWTSAHQGRFIPKVLTDLHRPEELIFNMTSSELFLQCGASGCVHHFQPHLEVVENTQRDGFRAALHTHAGSNGEHAAALVGHTGDCSGDQARKIHS